MSSLTLSEKNLTENDTVNLKSASFTSKMCLFGKSKELQIKTCHLRQSTGTSGKQRETAFIGKRRGGELGGAVLSESLLEESRW